MAKFTFYDYIRSRLDRFLLRRPRSEFEIRHYLRGKLIRKNIVDKDKQEAIIADLVKEVQDLGSIDDEKFAQWWVDERTYFKPRGKKALQFELYRKGIPKDIIDETITAANIDEKALILQLIAKKHFTDFNQKVIQFLLRKGFSYQNIKKAIEEWEKKR
ncbi:hypothetical protein A3F34_00090 [Candidatus Roizmanbacteria bacterium RIFCSPHIGHO2_12_FULL_44_10]|uniref:Regulatory protein RecX n=1 Tax=Candidatus Roizmanbacteria bacterium RIFCSPHIGHO2_12_FULL_44_10 TaxID=1802054 RepID=A0A1F7I5A8_9BACT|nr:MAG: hypothetical protein A3F34_00090 [Candidatus Roizmanbacteria bacterium RIFCSPHIGHO2_12_FULL_44_10]